MAALMPITHDTHWCRKVSLYQYVNDRCNFMMLWNLSVISLYAYKFSYIYLYNPTNIMKCFIKIYLNLYFNRIN